MGYEYGHACVTSVVHARLKFMDLKLRLKQTFAVWERGLHTSQQALCGALTGTAAPDGASLQAAGHAVHMCAGSETRRVGVATKAMSVVAVFLALRDELIWGGAMHGNVCVGSAAYCSSRACLLRAGDRGWGTGLGGT